MSRAARIAKLERELELMEASFREQLVAALKDTAGGYWGLFGQHPPAYWSDDARALLSLGDEIEGIRAELGMEPCELVERFKWYRKSRGPHTFGEPRLAQQFLAELT